MRLKHSLLRRSEHTVNPTQHSEWQDDILVFAAFECVTDEVGNRPDETDFLAEIIHYSPRKQSTTKADEII